MGLAGSCILKRCGYNKIPFAFNTHNGAIIIGLKNRIFDVKNAFNATSRKRRLEVMEEDRIDDDLITYFHTLYGRGVKRASDPRGWQRGQASDPRVEKFRNFFFPTWLRSSVAIIDRIVETQLSLVCAMQDDGVSSPPYDP